MAIVKTLTLFFCSWLICGTAISQTNQLNQAVDLCLEKHKGLGESHESILLFIPDALTIGPLKSQNVKIVEEVNDESIFL
jgi:hypothetical protein